MKIGEQEEVKGEGAWMFLEPSTTRQTSKKRDRAGSPAQAASGWPGSSAKSEERAWTLGPAVSMASSAQRGGVSV